MIINQCGKLIDFSICDESTQFILEDPSKNRFSSRQDRVLFTGDVEVISTECPLETLVGLTFSCRPRSIYFDNSA